MRASAFLLRSLAVLVLAGCGATTGADLEIVGADKLNADQIKLVGMVDGQAVHTSIEPSTAKTFGNVEDLRIVVPDSYAGQVLKVTGTLLKAGAEIGTPLDGAGLMVANRTKRIVLCFDPDPSGCAGK